MFTATMALCVTALLSPTPAAIEPLANRPHARQGAKPQQKETSARQLLAVRGEIVKMQSQSKGLILITVRPAKEFAEVTVLARENDLVGSAVGGAGETDLLGLLAGDSREDETITAAELNEGDIVSVIYDPQLQNRLIEIYLH